MVRWEKESGRSECPDVTSEIEHETLLNAKAARQQPRRKRADVRKVSHCERVWRTFEDGKAKDSH
ncbi:MAG: hypothetical protein JRK26_25825 [Deltaproteobacteria bacterium]|nr:hypothetical protein [Deltaproteobacteria bacterium]